uniref:Sugar phosphate transporter domain-containing protein n=1 Tax=Alexandrium catenella TaxID=2925 RepID=A0A7S1RFA6_ALECA
MRSSAAAVPMGISAPSSLMVYGRKLAVCLAYIAVSAVLIRFNKFMMEKDKFPHALALSAGHMLVSSAWCWVLYLLAPSLFPSMEATKGQRLDLAKWFVPISLLFAVCLFGSNQAYLYCNVTFLQFMKEANAMIVFTISCIAGLQSCSRVRVFVITWVILSASVSISGEVHFVLLGFLFQAVSQLAECTRHVMGECLLRGKMFDPLTYTLFLAPGCFLVLAVANACRWSPGILGDLARCWQLLLANASVAFVLNLLVACVVKECSAVGFVLCGIAKDIVIVAVSSLAFGEVVTHKQTAAFVVTLAGIFFWSSMKTHPDSLPLRALEAVLGTRREKGEESPLMPRADEQELVDKKV